ncbi:DUF998 domain-containing protein [Sphaerisporangium aureirubrum]|uniref:DUF998 domain-containing protein n=1 Tax=Sphaerisporangium aureirubrum TaxID=1544736 RepID=A0ABW1NAX6_9ACTN
MLPLRRLYPLVAGAGVLAASLTLVIGRIGGPDGMADLTIARYAALDGGRAAALAVGLLGVSSLLLAAGMRAVRAPVAGWPQALTLAWAVSAVIAAVAPGTRVAEVAMLVALVSMAGATALMSRRFGADERWLPIARPMEWLALAAGGTLAVLTYVSLPGHGVLAGLVEWTLLGVETAALALVAAHQTRVAWDDAAHRPYTVESAATRAAMAAAVDRVVAGAASLQLSRHR